LHSGKLFSEEMVMYLWYTKSNENNNTGILESDSQAGSLSYYGYFLKETYHADH
jgi:hypothetical protein